MARPSLPPPYLKSISFYKIDQNTDKNYPFSLPWVSNKTRFEFTSPITIIVGENGCGKSTFLEAIGSHAGYNELGGGKGYRPLDNTDAIEKNGNNLSEFMRFGWLPKVTTGWFFRAESFFSVARYLDQSAISVGAAAPDYLSKSHGEGFLDFFSKKLINKGIFLLDEPESALSPMKQLTFLKQLIEVRSRQKAQVIVVTHSPIIMFLPDAQLVRLTGTGFENILPQETEHYKIYSQLCSNLLQL